MVAVVRLVLIGFLASGLLATIVVGSQSLFSVDGALCIHSPGSGGR